jgi:hypothetical protein
LAVNQQTKANSQQQKYPLAGKTKISAGRMYPFLNDALFQWNNREVKIAGSSQREVIAPEYSNWKERYLSLLVEAIKV